MSKPEKLGQTPSQTVGPYFAYGLTPEQYGYDFVSISKPIMADSATPGKPIRVEGVVYDGAGSPINDALVEFWQADGNGFIATPGSKGNGKFNGLGRCGTGTMDGNFYRFETVKPGINRKGEAPFIQVILTMRGLLNHVFTRIYFAEEGAANAADPILALVPKERQGTLMARETSPGLYRFDIHMQGDNETVFFDM